MQTLSEHIKGQPEKTMADWAAAFGISRPHLYALLDGSRHPSIDVATRIDRATDGKVPAGSWPNIRSVIDGLAASAPPG